MQKRKKKSGRVPAAAKNSSPQRRLQSPGHGLVRVHAYVRGGPATAASTACCFSTLFYGSGVVVVVVVTACGRGRGRGEHGA